MRIDFYVSVIDNYGDFGFALHFACLWLQQYPEANIRFFGDNKLLFEKMIGKQVWKNLEYKDLTQIHSFEPSPYIFNFFDRKIDFSYLNQFDFEKCVINFGYLLFHSGVASLHGTTYQREKNTVIHIIPSLGEGTGGVLHHRFPQKIHREDRRDFFSNDPEISQKKWVSLFVYPKTYEKIFPYIQKYPQLQFFLFDAPQTYIAPNVIHMPFLSISDYYDFLYVCDTNFVRGENSVMQAFFSQKPFLWDIYKEHNVAHKYKIEDFNTFLLQSFGEKVDGYTQCFTDFNEEEYVGRTFDNFLSTSPSDYFFGETQKKFSSLDIITHVAEIIKKHQF